MKNIILKLLFFQMVMRIYQKWIVISVQSSFSQKLPTISTSQTCIQLKLYSHMPICFVISVIMSQNSGKDLFRYGQNTENFQYPRANVFFLSYKHLQCIDLSKLSTFQHFKKPPLVKSKKVMYDVKVWRIKLSHF